jgi:putative transcriptional regulator
MKLKNLAEEIGISYINLSNIKMGKIKAIRFSTLDSICKALNCLLFAI